MKTILNYDSAQKSTSNLFSVKPTGHFLASISSKDESVRLRIVFHSKTEGKILIGNDEFAFRLSDIDHTVNPILAHYSFALNFITYYSKEAFISTTVGSNREMHLLSTIASRLTIVQSTVSSKPTLITRGEIVANETSSDSKKRLSAIPIVYQPVPNTEDRPISKAPGQKDTICRIDSKKSDRKALSTIGTASNSPRIPTLPVHSKNSMNLPWVVCCNLPTSCSAKDLQRFFSGLTPKYFFATSCHADPNLADVFIEFDTIAGAELAALRSGEELRLEQKQLKDNKEVVSLGTVVISLTVQFINDEEAVWAKSLGLQINGNTSIKERLYNLRQLLSQEYLLVNMFELHSFWAPVTRSMTHFHQKPKGTTKTNKGKKRAPITENLDTNSHFGNLRDRYCHLPDNIALDEVFLDDFVFSFETSSIEEFSCAETSGDGFYQSSEIVHSMKPFLVKVTAILRESMERHYVYSSLSFGEDDKVHILGSLLPKECQALIPEVSSPSIEVSIGDLTFAKDHLSRWIHLFKIILAELWSITHTYSAGFTDEEYPQSKKGKRSSN